MKLKAFFCKLYNINQKLYYSYTQCLKTYIYIKSSSHSCNHVMKDKLKISFQNLIVFIHKTNNIKFIHKMNDSKEKQAII